MRSGRAAVRGPVLVLVAVLLASAVALLGPSAGAQDPAPTSVPATSSTVAELPPAEMIPRPDSGEAPREAGDRGGSLQLLLLGLVVVGIAVGVAKLVRDSRQARADGDVG